MGGGRRSPRALLRAHQGGGVTVAMPSVPPPAPAPVGPRRRLRLVGAERTRRLWIARMVLEGLRAELPTLFALRELYDARPRTRAECEGGPRPCPFVSCKYNLFLETARRTGTLRINRPGTDPLEMPAEESCALDVADGGAQSQAEVARLLGGVSIEWVRQTEVAGRAEMRVRGGPALRALLAEHAEEPARSSGPGTLADLAGDEIAPRVVTPADDAAEIERWAEDVAALMGAGLRAVVAARIVNHRTEVEEMAPKKGSKKAKKKAAQAATKANGAIAAAPANDAGNPALPPGAVEKHRYDDRLPCKLTEDEIQDLEIELASITCGRIRKEQEAELIRETIKGVKERERDLADQIGKAEETRDVECIEYLLPTLEIITVRADTGEIIPDRKRTATAHELQEPIPGTAAAQAPAAADDGPREGDIEQPDDFLSEDRPQPTPGA